MAEPVKLSSKAARSPLLPGDRITVVRRAVDEPDPAKRVFSAEQVDVAASLPPSGVSLLWRVGGVDGTRGYRAGQLLRNALGVDFYYAADIANPQAEPLLAESTAAVNALVKRIGPALYATPGQDTDGGLTRKAATDALNARFTNRGAWAANTAYQPNDFVVHFAVAYYRAGAAFTSGATFNAANWVAAGLSGADVDASVASALLDYSLLSLLLEIENPPQFGPVGTRQFRPVDNTSYFFTTGGPLAMEGGGMACVGALVSVRLAENAAAPLALQAIGGGGVARAYEVAPGEMVQFALVPANHAPAAAGPDLLVWKVVSRSAPAAADTFAVLPYAASIVVDFNTETVRTLAATGNIAYGASLNVTLLKTKEHYITNATAAAITLSFPAGWSFFPGPAPTSLAAGKEAVLTLRSLGTTDSAVKAAYVTGTAGTATPAITANSSTPS